MTPPHKNRQKTPSSSQLDQKKKQVQIGKKEERASFMYHGQKHYHPPEKLDILYSSFFRNPKPPLDEISSLEKKTGLPSETITLWFSNQRKRPSKNQSHIRAVIKKNPVEMDPDSEEEEENEAPLVNTGTDDDRTVISDENEKVMKNPVVGKMKMKKEIEEKEDDDEEDDEDKDEDEDEEMDESDDEDSASDAEMKRRRFDCLLHFRSKKNRVLVHKRCGSA